MSTVSFDGPSRTFVLTTPATCYVFRLDPDDAPRHLHWGPRLAVDHTIDHGDGHGTDQAAGPPAELSGTSGFSAVTGDGKRVTGEELAVEGGARFGVPSLQVRYGDGARGVEWRYLDHTIDAGRLAVRFRDRHYPLEITLHYRVFDDTDVIERSVALRHTGGGDPIELLRCDSANWTIPPRPGYRLSHVTGDWAAESQLHRVSVACAETTLTSRRGITSHQANPWIMIDDGDATENQGEVWSAALAWSGSWRITLRRDDLLTVTGGFGHDGITWRLHSDSEWESPVFAGLYTSAGYGAASRTWHGYVAGHVLPRSDELRPVLYNSWEATGFAVDEDGQKRLAAAAAELGVELFVMDDGWFGARTGDHAGLGDWRPNPDRFPNGLGPLIDEVHRYGMRFGLWVEPEMVNPDSDLYRAHPDWVLHMPNRRRTLLRNQLVLNLARTDVADWTHQWLDDLVTADPIDFLKWDMNRPFTEAGRPGDPDAERLWVDHARNVYAIMDRLRADHPALRIESCSGGGGRADLGILARTDQVWVSDNTDALDRLAIQRGYSQIYPARTMSAWVTDSPNPYTGREIPLRFRFHVAMAGVLGIGGNLLTWPDEDIAEAARLVAQYKQIRPVVQHGVLHRLGTGRLTAVQYTAGDQIVVIAWRTHDRRSARLRLAGLDPAARYRDQDTGAEHDAGVLLAHGLPLVLPESDYASRLIRLIRLSG